MADLEERLKNYLKQIEFLDMTRDYGARTYYIYKAMAEAMYLTYRVGIRIDPSEPEWPVAFIELPTGQVSWRLEQHLKEWDGHTLTEKYERIKRFVDG